MMICWMMLDRNWIQTFDVNWIDGHAMNDDVHVIASHVHVVKDTFHSLCCIVNKPRRGGVVDRMIEIETAVYSLLSHYY